MIKIIVEEWFEQKITFKSIYSPFELSFPKKLFRKKFLDYLSRNSFWNSINKTWRKGKFLIIYHLHSYLFAYSESYLINLSQIIDAISGKIVKFEYIIIKSQRLIETLLNSF